MKISAIVAALLLPACVLCVEPCCTPHQWETPYQLTAAGGLPYISGRGRLSYDHMSNMSADTITVLMADGATAVRRVVARDGKYYIIDDQNGKCSQNTRKFQQFCVPPWFNYMATVTLGDSAEQFNGQVFHMDAGNSNFTMVMTQQRCSFLSFTASYGKSALSLVSAYNTTDGIKDPSVFDIPDVCKSPAARRGLGASGFGQCGWAAAPSALPSLHSLLATV